MRKAGHAIELCLGSLTGVVVKEAEAEDGSEDETCCESTEVVGKGNDVRGTPHKLQIRAAAGLRPGGLRLPQTSHSQLSNPVSCPLGSDKAESPERWQVTFGEDLKRPA